MELNWAGDCVVRRKREAAGLLNIESLQMGILMQRFLKRMSAVIITQDRYVVINAAKVERRSATSSAERRMQEDGEDEIRLELHR